MSETKKPFNLLKFVYAKLFSQQCLCLNAQSCIFEQTSKIYSWTSVLCWLKKQGYVYDFKIKNVDEDKSVLAYKFNRQKLMYEPYLKAIERNLKKDSLAIEPMGDLIEKKAVDDFTAQFKYPVEYIDVADRCLKELNEDIRKEIENLQDEKVVNIDKKKKTA